MLFKVLGATGEPIHGGSGSWPFPRGTRPGAWFACDRTPKVCEHGLHLVSEPIRWWKPKARLFVAEADVTLPISADGTEKAAFKRARLLYEVTPEWPLLPMFPAVRVFLVASALSRGDEETAKRLLAGANLADANLTGANLARANLADANLADANLTGAYLAGAYLARANLTGANLARANLADANLTGANLADANLTGAYRPANPPAGWESGKKGLLVKKP